MILEQKERVIGYNIKEKVAQFEKMYIRYNTSTIEPSAMEQSSPILLGTISRIFFKELNEAHIEDDKISSKEKQKEAHAKRFQALAQKFFPIISLPEIRNQSLPRQSMD